MDPAHIARLQEEQQKGLAVTEERIQQLDKFKSDYNALKCKLKTLPDKVSYDVMVPFGSLAFMPGKLVHTNEILVLLGDNWFAEKSAKDAVDVVDRRIKSLDQSLAELSSQKKLLEPRLDFTSELRNISEDNSEIKEINEIVTEEEDKTWREKHRRRTTSYKKKTSQAKDSNNSSQEEEKPKTHDDIWARLEKLEQIESERHEMERLPDVPQSSISQSEPSLKSVHWGDGYHVDTSSDISSDSDTSLGHESAQSNKKRIEFSHSASSQGVSDVVDAATTDGAINSPADIYKQYTKTTLHKSILKQSSKEDEKIETKDIPNIKAFSASVVETSLEELSKKVTDKKDTSSDQPPKRVSKFKAQRQKQMTDNR